MAKDKQVQKLSGPISDRLRAKLKTDDRAWNPGRPASPTKAGPVPAHVEGHRMTGRKK